jgi:hypothetical protein
MNHKGNDELQNCQFVGVRIIKILIFVKDFSRIDKEKKGQTEHRTAQPPTLATFRSWGSSAGAGRAGLPGGKDTIRCELFAK